LIAFLAAASSAHAQVPQVDHLLGWKEVIAGTNTPVNSPDGIIEPGEAVRIELSITFTPVGTLVAYQFPPPGGVAPVAGFGGSLFRLIATSASNGTWSSPYGAIPGFSVSIGSVDPDGSLEMCGVTSPEPPLGSLPNPVNPLTSVWTAVWTPSVYDSRQVSFQQQNLISIPPYHPSVWVLRGSDPNGNPLLGLASANGTYGSTVSIPLVPAAPTGVAFALGLLAATGGRRR
jgi:hypothetical protein